MNHVKVSVVTDPPANVTAHFDNLYRLEEVPCVLVEVRILCSYAFSS